MKRCVFAGTFDPITKGHEYVVNKCLAVFDKVVIAVGVNTSKSPVFSLEERLEIIKTAFEGEDRVEVKAFDGMLGDFMQENGIEFTVRGIRDEQDYKYETTMAKYNADMFPKITTVYFPTPVELTYVSSSAIRNIIELNGNYAQYLPDKAVCLVKKILNEKR